MKVALLHGPAITSSRKKLTEIKQKFDPNNVVSFDGSASPQNILGAVRTHSMFGEEQLVVVENPPSDLSVDSLLITNNQSPITLLLWFDKEIDPKKFPGAEIHFFPEAKEVSVFPFLDNLGNKDKRAFIELDKLKKAGFDNQYIITMIFYLLRTLSVTPKNSPEFVKKKISKQRENFSPNELVSLYKYVIETDFKIKSGLMEQAQAEFLLVNKFVQ